MQIHGERQQLFALYPHRRTGDAAIIKHAFSLQIMQDVIYMKGTENIILNYERGK
jgi:hypothetical protein